MNEPYISGSIQQGAPFQAAGQGGHHAVGVRREDAAVMPLQMLIKMSPELK